jgi:single-strand DNA-binding protein
MVNKVILIGNLGRDPEVRHLESGATVAKFSVATNESYQDKSGEWQTITEWHNVVAWRSLAERAEKQLKKGMMVYVEGKLSTRKWQDRDGNDRYSTDVVANTFRMLERRERTGSDTGFPEQEPAINMTTTGAVTSNPQPQSHTGSGGAEVDDLPF